MNNDVIESVSTDVTTIQQVSDFLQTILQKMNIGTFSIESTTQDDAICLNIVGSDTNAVIGYHGETLDALQYLCNLKIGSNDAAYKRVILDSEGYRAKREKALQKLALNLEQKVKRTGRPAKLEHMNPYERRIIHTALQNSKYVTTESEGQGNARHIVVSPKAQSNVLNAPNAPRKTLNFVYHSDKKKR